MAELGKFDANGWLGDVTVPTGVLVTSNDKVSNRLPAPLPASGPMNKGSKAALFSDSR